MRFGLQKMTLLDFPGKIACTVFTSGCTFRCPFCHNGSLVRAGAGDGAMTSEELLAFLRRRSGVLEGVCLTGGEPLMHRELFAFLKEVRDLGYPVKLDTNGSFPDRLKEMMETGLVSYVAMDIKNTPEKYAVTAGFSGSGLLESVRTSVDLLLKSGMEYEFRTTVVKGFHEVKDFAAIGAWIKGCKRYFLQKFVDSGDVLGDASRMGALPDVEMRQCLEAVRPYVPGAELRGVE